MPLSPQRRKFVDEYLVDLNGTKAAIRAGYSERTAASQASRLLKIVNIAEEVTARLAKQRAAAAAAAEDRPMSIDDVRRELARIGRADIRKVVRWRADVRSMVEDPDTGEMDLVHTNDVELVNSEDIPDDVAAAIAEVSRSANGSLKIKLHNKTAALSVLERSLSQAARPPAPKGKARETSPADPPAAPSGTDGWAELLEGSKPN